MTKESWLNQFNVTIVDEANAGSFTAPNKTEFSQLMEKEGAAGERFKEGEVIDGRILNIGDEYVTIDIGYKSEGIVPTNEFRGAGGVIQARSNDTIAVYIEKVENDSGVMVLSKDKADIIRAWDEISHACESNQVVEGVVIQKMKGGLKVDIGVKAFLPGSLVDTQRVRNLDKYVGQKLKFKVIKFNKKRKNIVLSRKAYLLQEKEDLRVNLLENIEEGQVVKGRVKNITDYGAFIDLGGIDGLLHITDMSWGRIKHPSEILKVGDDIDVKVLKYDKEKERVNLGLKQIQPDPWEEVAAAYKIGQRVKGKVVNVKEYGAFVELTDGIEGLVHVSDMSWTQKVKHAKQIVDVGQEIETVVLSVDPQHKRISLGLKQLEINPWNLLEDKYPKGAMVEGVVKNVMDFGIFIDIGEGIDGLVHISDFSWTKRPNHPGDWYKVDDKVKGVVLGVDKEQEKFSIGIKQLTSDPWDTLRSKIKVNSSVLGKVTRLTEYGAFVDIGEGIEGLIHISEMSENRVDSPGAMLKEGQEVEVEVISMDNKERKIGLSIKALTRTREREDYESAMSKHDDSSKTSLGDILNKKK